MPPRNVRVVDEDVALLRPAERRAIAVDAVALAAPREHGNIARRRGHRDRGGLVRRRDIVGLVDDRRRGRQRLDRRRGSLLVALRLDDARRDPELAAAEVVVRFQLHERRAEERIVLALRVLDDVLLELGEQRKLVGLELLAVCAREVDGVLVGDVGAADGDRAVVVHLLRQLPRQLDRLDVRAEGAAEDALEERLDLLLDSSQHHRRRA